MTANALHQLLGGLRSQLPAPIFDEGREQPTGIVVNPALAFVPDDKIVVMCVFVDVIDTDFFPFVHIAQLLDPA